MYTYHVRCLSVMIQVTWVALIITRSIFFPEKENNQLWLTGNSWLCFRSACQTSSALVREPLGRANGLVLFLTGCLERGWHISPQDLAEKPSSGLWARGLPPCPAWGLLPNCWHLCGASPWCSCPGSASPVACLGAGCWNHPGSCRWMDCPARDQPSSASFKAFCEDKGWVGSPPPIQGRAKNINCLWAGTHEMWPLLIPNYYGVFSAPLLAFHILLWRLCSALLTMY